MSAPKHTAGGYSVARDVEGWKVFDRDGYPITKGLSTCAAAIKARARIIAKATGEGAK